MIRTPLSQWRSAPAAALLAALCATVIPTGAGAQDSTAATRDTTPPAQPSPSRQPQGTRPPAATKTKTPPVSIQVRALLDLDDVEGSAQLPPPNHGFGIRRARVFVNADGPAGLFFRSQFDPTVLANGPQSAAPYRGVPLAEAYVGWKFSPVFLVQAGQQRVPFGLASTTGAPSYPLPEYPQFPRYTYQRASALRDVGIVGQGHFGAVQVAAGLFSGAGINVPADNDSTRDMAARVTWAIVPGFEMGAGAWRGHTGNLYARAPGTAPLKVFYDNADFRRFETDARLARGPVLLSAEYGKDRTDHNPKAANPTPGAGSSADEWLRQVLAGPPTTRGARTSPDARQGDRQGSEPG